MKRKAKVLACAVALFSAANAAADSVGVNFRRGSGEQLMGSSEQAGVVVQQFWNNTDGAQTGNSGANIPSPTLNSVVNNNGATVNGLTLNWSSNGTWSAPNAGPGDLNLMSGYLDDTGTAGDTVITVTGVPYAFYDVYAYLGSDGNDRTGRTRLFGHFSNDRWIRTNTAPFTGFVEGTATTEAASVASNYTRYTSLNSSNFSLNVLRGNNNVGLHGIQIVETDGSAGVNWAPKPTLAPAAPAALLPALDSIGINFVGGRADAGQPDGHVEDDGIVLGSAGVAAQGNWNNLNGATGTAAPGTVVRRDGSASTTSVTWTSNNLYTVATGAAGDDNAALMKGYLDSTDVSTTTVAVAGVPADWAKYDVIVYLDGDADAGRAGNYTITSLTGGTKTATVSDVANWVIGSAGGAFTRANENANDMNTDPGFTTGNYLVFTGLTDPSFILTAQGSFIGAIPPRAPINGIQMVATELIPEPGSITLLALGALSLAGRRRKR